MLYFRYLLVDHKKIHDRIKELQKMKHLPPSRIMSVKRFKSYRSLKLMSQKSVGKKLTMAKKKANYLFLSISHPSNAKNIAISMTILKICERSFKWELAGCPSSICLEMALGWRQVVENLEIHCVIFKGYLYSISNIKIKHIEL